MWDQVNSPVQVKGLTSGVQSIAVGEHHACAVMRSGAVKCWGRSDLGQLGNPALVSAGESNVPVDVPALTSGVVSLGLGGNHSCAVTSGGNLYCWGDNSRGAVGAGGTKVTSPTLVSLPEPVVSVEAGAQHTCARLKSGAISCWGMNTYGQLGRGTFGETGAIAAVSGSINNASLVASQGSVLVERFASASGAVAGHITPIPWSMADSKGAPAAVVTYDPLAAAAAMFIEQYDAHVAACTATTSETDIVEDDGNTFTNGQMQGKRLWACTSSAGKTGYLGGMQALLNGARHYLFGHDGGCVQSTETVAGSACPSTTTGPDPVHYPYTFHVPSYTSAAYNTAYATQLSSALDTYRADLLGKPASRLARTLQLVGFSKMDASKTAIVTSHVTRSGSYGTDCVLGDAFTAQ